MLQKPLGRLLESENDNFNNRKEFLQIKNIKKRFRGKGGVGKTFHLHLDSYKAFNQSFSSIFFYLQFSTLFCNVHIVFSTLIWSSQLCKSLINIFSMTCIQNEFVALIFYFFSYTRIQEALRKKKHFFLCCKFSW